MRQLEVFFDYACPYCRQGHLYLEELKASMADIEILWRPCEAHPRPDRYGPHSDLCIQGMFYAQNQGVDLWMYHRRMYEAAFADTVDIENPMALAQCVHGLLEPKAFLAALQQGRYTKQLQEANDYAYKQSGVWVVPAFRMGAGRLDAAENIGVTKPELQRFLLGGTQ
ncbi:DsbA family protein [Ruminococcaceae bacterium OttesenSCG-928-I18]|nr:DsbA family protein [Ruminococcaceae bacterium OttesenSCG-928-I18]